MPAMIRPSLMFHVYLGSASYSEDVAAEINRSYSYVGHTVVSLNDSSSADENILRLVVMLNKPYWDTCDAESAALWKDVFPQWLENMFRKITNTMESFNALRAEKDEEALFFDRLEVEFGSHALLSVGLQDGCVLPSNAVELVDQARLQINEAVVGKETTPFVARLNEGAWELCPR